MDEADITWSRFEHEYAIQVRDRNMKRVLEIQRALDRLEAGEFGICVECGDDIAMERLEAHPAAAVCITCKRAEETFTSQVA